MKHNENSRVKIPALVHLTRLGYEYDGQPRLLHAGNHADDHSVVPHPRSTAHTGSGALY